MSSSNDEVVVLAILADSPCCTLVLKDGDAEEEFRVQFEDIRGIRLMKESDSLTRWCMSRGQLWALDPLYKLADAAVRGEIPAVPVCLTDPRPKG